MHLPVPSTVNVLPDTTGTLVESVHVPELPLVRGMGIWVDEVIDRLEESVHVHVPLGLHVVEEVMVAGLQADRVYVVPDLTNDPPFVKLPPATTWVTVRVSTDEMTDADAVKNGVDASNCAESLQSETVLA